MACGADDGGNSDEGRGRRGGREEGLSAHGWYLRRGRARLANNKTKAFGVA